MNTVIDNFQTNDYCVVKSAISQELLDFVTQYTLFDEMQNFSPNDNQVAGAHSKYGDPAMETLLLHLHPIMESNTGLSLHPTYSYYRVYRNGDELAKHRDRPSCEISCTLCLNYEYADKNYSWPIFMDGTSVTLEPGDLVIYRGCELDHWREKFNGANSDWHVQGFFHYVNKNGPYADWKYDKRNSIGEVNKTPSSQISSKSYISFTG